MTSGEMKHGTCETGVPVASVCYDWTIKNLHVICNNSCLAEEQCVDFSIADNKGAKYTWRVSVDRVTDCRHWSLPTHLFTFKKTLVSMSSDMAGDIAEKSVHSVCIIQMLKEHAQWVNRGGEVVQLRNGLECDPYLAQIGPDTLEAGESSKGEMGLDKIYEPCLPREVTIHVKFTQYSSAHPPTNGSSTKKVEQMVTRDLSRLLAGIQGDKTTADANILSKDGITFPAHRFILSARSPVFQAMFQTTMKEASSGEIECDDLSGKCLKALLHFFYTGNLADDWDDVEVLWELAYAAEKYQVKDLLEFFDASLAAMCTPQEAPTLLILANKLSLKNAEKGLFDLIKKSATNSNDLVATMGSLMMRFGTTSP